MATRTRPRLTSRSRSSRASASVSCFSATWPETLTRAGVAPAVAGVEDDDRPARRLRAPHRCGREAAGGSSTLRLPRRAVRRRPAARRAEARAATPRRAGQCQPPPAIAALLVQSLRQWPAKSLIELRQLITPKWLMRNYPYICRSATLCSGCGPPTGMLTAFIPGDLPESFRRARSAAVHEVDARMMPSNAPATL